MSTPQALLSDPDCDNAATIALVEGETERSPTANRSLYRIFWRWHFYAGVCVGPVLLVVAITGAIYVFKSELERIFYSRTMFVVPQAATVSLDHQVAAAVAAYPGWKADTLEVDADPTRATGVRIRRGTESQRVYVNPHTGTIQGAIGEGSFFRVVLAIHRRLFIGTAGRIIVELVTGWTIVLLVTGLYLWFPRRRKKFWGIVLPRLRAKPYTVLRDLHAVAGAWLAPITLMIAGTGLVYSLAWGSVYEYATLMSGDDVTSAAKSEPTSVSVGLPLDQVVAIVRAHYPDAAFIDVALASPIDTLVARAKMSEQAGPRNRAVFTLNRSTGEVLSIKTNDQLPLLGRWRTTWNYPLHVGSILGMPTKVLWLMACLVLAALPITGLCMWWKRRPIGSLGLPKRLNRNVPWWLIGAIGITSVFLPMVGISVVLILMSENLARRFASAD